jgi:hypothetical protein
LQIILKDSAASSNDWRARILSGSGSPANNSALPVVGSIIIWVKTSSAGANGKIAITVDDAAGGTEISAQQSITNDGAWHSYSFDLQGTGWTSFAGGNGKIDGSTITLDAVILYNSNAAPDWTLYLDDITFSSSGTPLPVELNSFIAEVKNSKVMLKWQTQTEINNYGFEIERYTPSINNLSWKVIGFVEGNGNSNSPKQYRFTDIKPIYNTALRYRLKQIDLDGSYQYSPEVETIVRDEDIKLNQNYPNPFNPATVISYTLPNIGKIRVKLAIYDLLGRQVAVLIDEIQHEGNYTVNFNSANYSMGSGIYFYKLTVGESNFVKKMILMK